MAALTPGDRRYLVNVLLVAFSVRALVVILFWATDAIYRLRLSPDSERYHRVGIHIMHQMERGHFDWPAWIDGGWFQFTGLVYFLLGPNPVLMQLINITLSSLTALVVFHLALEVSRSSPVARVSALLVAIFPSFIYWSCLMLKDPAAIFSMSLLVLATVKLRAGFSVRWLIALLLGLMVFLGIRDYMFFVAIGMIGISLTFFTPYLLPRWGSWVTLGALALVPYTLGYGVFGMNFLTESIYFDLDYINSIRVAMGDHGSGAIYDHDDVATWGSGGLLANVVAFLKGMTYFFITLNPANIGSLRQLMALPEVLLVLLLIPHLFRGLYWLWLDRRRSFPLIIFALGVMVMLVSATTNIGALFRWRMQVMPLLVIAMAIGVFWWGRGPFYRLACWVTGMRI